MSMVLRRPMTGYAPRTIIVKTGKLDLHFVLDERHALRFPIGVTKAGHLRVVQPSRCEHPAVLR